MIERIKLYHTAYQVCLGGTAIFFCCSVFLFFRFKIAKMIADRSGRALRKSMKDTNAKHAQTETLGRSAATSRVTEGFRITKRVILIHSGEQILQQ